MKVLLGQHCVSELLKNLLDILHEEMKKFGKKSIIKDLFSLELAQVIQLKWQENHHSCIFSNVKLGVKSEQQVKEIFPSWCCNSPWRVSEVRPLHGLLQKCGN